MVGSLNGSIVISAHGPSFLSSDLIRTLSFLCQIPQALPVMPAFAPIFAACLLAPVLGRRQALSSWDVLQPSAKTPEEAIEKVETAVEHSVEVVDEELQKSAGALGTWAKLRSLSQVGPSLEDLHANHISNIFVGPGGPPGEPAGQYWLEAKMTAQSAEKCQDFTEKLMAELHTIQADVFVKATCKGSIMLLTSTPALPSRSGAQPRNVHLPGGPRELH